MKVKDLIEILAKLDGNKIIYTENFDSEYGFAINTIDTVTLLNDLGAEKDGVIANSNIKDIDCYVVKML